MGSAVTELTEALSSVSFASPRIPVVLNVDGAFHDDPAKIQQLLARQVVEPVRWESSMRLLLDGDVAGGINAALEESRIDM